VEESKGKVKSLAVFRLLVLGELSVFRVFENLQHILLERHGRLHSHLYTILQDRHRELRCGHGGHPQSKVGVISFCELVHELLKSGHPRQTQMAIF